MKQIRLILGFLTLLFLLINIEIEIHAMQTGFSTELLSEEDVDTFLSNVNVSLMPDEPPKKVIECFDVNEEGLIAIGYGSSGEKAICVYTTDGVYQYGYKFKTQGSFGVEWDKDLIMIYFVRSDVAIAVDSLGEVVDIAQIQNTSSNNSYWNKSVRSTKRKIGDVEYSLRNNMGFFDLFASSYSQLVVEDSKGGERIIHDVNSSQFVSIVVMFVGVLLLVCVAIFSVVWQFVKLRQKHK